MTHAHNPQAPILQLMNPQSAIRNPKSFSPRCTVGLLTWNAGDDGPAAVASVMAQTESPLELIWIDNASTDGTVERMRAQFPNLQPSVNPRNLGFCAGHNQGLAACRTPYYLALNQDVVLDPDYIAKLCDWLDAEPEVALASGLILTPDRARVYSAGMAWPRARFAFELGMGGPLREDYRRRRRVPAVDGAVMMLRAQACRGVSLPEAEVFPEEFFAYGEEVDLALRLARAGWCCGVEGSAVATHRARGSGGFKCAAIRARFFLNHWLLTLRHDGWATILKELPWTLRGELRYWLPEYARHPAALALALAWVAGRWPGARRFYREFERKFGPTRQKMDELRRASAAALRE